MNKGTNSRAEKTPNDARTRGRSRGNFWSAFLLAQLTSFWSHQPSVSRCRFAGRCWRCLWWRRWSGEWRDGQEWGHSKAGTFPCNPVACGNHRNPSRTQSWRSGVMKMGTWDRVSFTLYFNFYFTFKNFPFTLRNIYNWRHWAVFCIFILRKTCLHAWFQMGGPCSKIIIGI